MKKQPRIYKQEARAQRTEANTQEIVQAAIDRIRSARRLSQITLDEVAEKSGITVRTILRRFGSRDGLFEAAFQQLGTEIERARPTTTPGNTLLALRAMLAQYEHAGDLIVRALEEEDQIPLLHELLKTGRASHRAWLEQVYARHLAYVPKEDKEEVIAALYAATDVYVWKLLRRDLGLGKRDALHVMGRLANGVFDGYGDD